MEWLETSWFQEKNKERKEKNEEREEWKTVLYLLSYISLTSIVHLRDEIKMKKESI